MLFSQDESFLVYLWFAVTVAVVGKSSTDPVLLVSSSFTLSSFTLNVIYEALLFFSFSFVIPFPAE